MLVAVVPLIQKMHPLKEEMGRSSQLVNFSFSLLNCCYLCCMQIQSQKRLFYSILFYFQMLVCTRTAVLGQVISVYAPYKSRLEKMEPITFCKIMASLTFKCLSERDQSMIGRVNL